MLIIFDLDDTLIDTSGMLTPIQLNHALSSMIQKGLLIPNIEQALSVLYRLNRFAESGATALQEFLEIIDAPYSYYEIGYKALYQDFPSDSSINPLEGTLETLKFLSQSHDLALVSKGVLSQQYLKLKNAGIDTGLFNHIDIVTTGSKKDSYQTLLTHYQLDSKQVLVCGDRIDNDLKPAKELNCWTVHMQWGRGLRPISIKKKKYIDFTIKKIGDLKKILGKIE